MTAPNWNLPLPMAGRHEHDTDAPWAVRRQPQTTAATQAGRYLATSRPRCLQAICAARRAAAQTATRRAATPRAAGMAPPSGRKRARNRHTTGRAPGSSVREGRALRQSLEWKCRTGRWRGWPQERKVTRYRPRRGDRTPRSAARAVRRPLHSERRSQGVTPLQHHILPSGRPREVIQRSIRQARHLILPRDSRL